MPLDICHLTNYNTIMDRGDRDNLGEVIRRQRVMMALTLHELAERSGVSASHLGRIERGERFPSAHILRKIAEPLGFEENELFTLAGFLSPPTTEDAREKPAGTIPGLDPYVAQVLAQEPVKIQRSVITILTILKNIAEGMSKENFQR